VKKAQLARAEKKMSGGYRGGCRIISQLARISVAGELIRLAEGSLLRRHQ